MGLAQHARGPQVVLFAMRGQANAAYTHKAHKTKKHTQKASKQAND
jgi:hypothetical protein